MKDFEFNWGWVLWLIWGIGAIIALGFIVLRAIGWHFVAPY